MGGPKGKGKGKGGGPRFFQIPGLDQNERRNATAPLLVAPPLYPARAAEKLPEPWQGVPHTDELVNYNRDLLSCWQTFQPSQDITPEQFKDSLIAICGKDYFPEELTMSEAEYKRASKALAQAKDKFKGMTLAQILKQINDSKKADDKDNEDGEQSDENGSDMEEEDAGEDSDEGDDYGAQYEDVEDGDAGVGGDEDVGDAQDFY